MARSRRLQILFVVVVVTIALTAALSATIPLLFAWGIDALAAPTRDPEAVRYVIAFGAGLVLVGVMEQAQWLTFGPLNLLLQRNLTTRVFSHALSLPHYRLKGFTTYEIGRIVEKGLDAVREITSNLVFFVVPTFIELAIAAWVIAYAVDAWIAAWLFSALLVYGAITNLAAAKLRRSTGEAMEKGMDAWSFGLDGVANSELVQQSNWVGLFGARLDEKLRQSDRAWAATFRQRTLYGVLQALVFGIVVLAVLWRGATDVENGALTIGELVLLNAYIIRLLQPVETFARVYREIHASTGEVRLLADLLSLPAAPAPTALHLSPTPFSLELAGVSLSVNDRRLVSGLNLAVPSRSTLYVVGPSGVGKSSLLRVLSCLAMPDRGRYRIDGMAVDERTMAGFREHIAVVQQECLLFDWTVRENVAFGAEATPAEIDAALRQVGLDEVAARHLEAGEPTVGERGNRLSGGEKQRISLTRALLRKPRLLLLDEPTSALDEANRKRVMAAIESLQRECTTVVVTHDMQMIPADAAVLFLAASTHPIHGNHAELTRTCPSYRAFIEGQSPATKNDQWPSGVMPTR